MSSTLPVCHGCGVLPYHDFESYPRFGLYSDPETQLVCTRSSLQNYCIEHTGHCKKAVVQGPSSASIYTQSLPLFGFLFSFLPQTPRREVDSELPAYGQFLTSTGEAHLVACLWLTRLRISSLLMGSCLLMARSTCPNFSSPSFPVVCSCTPAFNFWKTRVVFPLGQGLTSNRCPWYYTTPRDDNNSSLLTMRKHFFQKFLLGCLVPCCYGSSCLM
jgi:hypothetical protein